MKPFAKKEKGSLSRERRKYKRAVLLESPEVMPLLTKNTLSEILDLQETLVPLDEIGTLEKEEPIKPSRGSENGETCEGNIVRARGRTIQGSSVVQE